jgi:hypothetical protein
MQRVQTRAVMLDVTQAVELKPDVVLPPGAYTGTETRIGVETISSGVSWTSPRYTIKFTADQLASLGAKVVRKLISAKIDVTKFVRSGEITAT